MNYYKVSISTPEQVIGDIKWPITQEQYVTLATGNTMPLPQDMYEAYACYRDDLLCTGVWNTVTGAWVSGVDAAQAQELYSTQGREPGFW